MFHLIISEYPWCPTQICLATTNGSHYSFCKEWSSTPLFVDPEWHRPFMLFNGCRTIDDGHCNGGH